MGNHLLLTLSTQSGQFAPEVGWSGRPCRPLDALTGVPLRSDFRHTSPPVASGEALTLDWPVVSDLPVAVDDARVTTRLE